MQRIRTVTLVIILALILASLAACSSNDDAADEPVGEADSQLVGIWDNPEASFYAKITFEADGSGTLLGIDNDMVPMTWTLEDDYLEFESNTSARSATSGGAFAWIEEGYSFSLDMHGTYTKIE